MTNLSKGHQINIIDDFKYLGSYSRSAEHDVKVRIGLARAAFAIASQVDIRINEGQNKLEDPSI